MPRERQSPKALTPQLPGRTPSDSLMHRLQWGLTVLSNVSVVTEMLAYKKGGKKSKWNWVSLVVA